MNQAAMYSREKQRIASRRAARRSVLDLAVLSALVWWALLAIVYRELVGHDGIVSFGGYLITTAEPGLVLLLACFLVLPVWRIVPRFRTIAAATALAVAALALIRGLMASPYDALFVGRFFLFAPAFIWLGVQLRGVPGVFDLIDRSVRRAGVALGLLAVLRLASGLPVNEVMLQDGRPLTSAGALILVVSTILYLSRALRSRRAGLDIWLAAFTFIACLLTGQGTASVAIIAGALIVLLLEPGRSLRLRLSLAFVLALLSPLVVPLMLSLSDSLARIHGLGDFVGARAATFEARTEFWSGFLDSFHGRSAIDQLVGLPMGTKEDVFVNLWGGTYWENSLHSMYFQQLSFYGYVGLAAYLAVMAAALWAAVRNRMAERPSFAVVSPSATLAIVSTAILFGYSYDLRGPTALLLMISLVLTDPRHARLKFISARRRSSPRERSRRRIGEMR